MEDFHGFMSKNWRRRSSGGSSTSSSRRVLSMAMGGEEEFQEEDVWSVLRERETPSPEMKIPKSLSSSSSWHISSTPRKVIPGRSNEASGVKQSSAPVNVPDWSMVYGSRNQKKKKKNNLGSWAHDDGDDSHDDSGGFGDDDDDCDDDDGGIVPPHEWIARKLARTQISSFSMCEGVGRTLKGRDLSKVRNAVLTKTGFLE